MAVLAPPSKVNDRVKTPKEDKAYFSKTLAAQMKRLVTLEDGRQVTIAEAAAERLTSIALFAESNQDAIAAAKVIFDRTEGRPAIIKDDTAKPIPKVTIKLNGEQHDRVARLSEEESEEEGEEEDPKILFKFDDGREYEG